MPTDDDSARKRPNLNEIATLRNGRDITRGFVEGLPWLQPTDSVWRDQGGWMGGWVEYENLLRDDQVAATFAQRRLAVVSRPWMVEAASDRRDDKKAADLVRDTLDRLAWDSITDQMLYARHFGFAVAEIIWAATPEGIRIADIRPRDRRRFVFAPDGAIKLLTSRNWQGEPLPPRKFWVATVGASHDDEPYGRGLAHALYGPVWLKREGAKFWGVFLEKFGAPTVVGRFHEGTTAEERARLLEAVKAVMTDAGIILPEGVGMELLEAGRGGQAGYEVWMRYWDAAIAKIVLGQTMTTEDGSSRSQAEVHMSVRQDIVQADADLIDASATESWVRWLVEYNYPNATPPRIHRDLSDPEDMQARAKRDVDLYGIGIRLTPDAVKRVYGDDYELVPVAAAPAAGAPPGADMTDVHAAHAEPAAEPTHVDIQAERLATEAAPAWAAVLDGVRALVESAESLPALRDALLAAYGDLPTDQLTQVMAMAFAAADLAGRYDLERESGAE